jgi:magnesium transporter
MESSRSLSQSSTYGRPDEDYHSDELNDHRHQPHSLPVRNSFESLDDVLADREDEPVSNFGIDPVLSGRRNRALSQGSSRRERANSRSSCAISENSIESSKVEGILLNSHDGPSANNNIMNEKNSPVPPRKRSRRLTRSSVISDKKADNEEADTGSRASYDEDQKQEDVCFPMKADLQVGIDIQELDAFSEAERNTTDVPDRDYYKPFVNHQQQGHRPLVPPGFGEGKTSDSDTTQVDPDARPVKNQWKETLQEKVPGGDIPPEVSWGMERRQSFTMDRYSFMASESDVTVHAPDLASLVEEGQSFQDLFNQSNGTWWLDCLNPTEREMKVISKAFGIHPLTTEDIRTRETREKVELFKTYYFVCFHTFDCDPESADFLEPINMFIVVFKEGILSFHYTPVQHPANVRRRIRQLQDYVNVSSDWICYALLDDITDSFAPIIKEIEYETDGIEESVFQARECDFGFMLQRIGRARKKVMTLLRLLFGKADVIKMFAKRCNERWDNAPRGEIGLYLGDIQDHIVTMYQNLSVYEKIFSRSHGNYLAQLQVESVNSNNRVTKVLGRVTMIGTILVPLNLVTGLFGMNVRVPGQDDGDSNLAWFFGIIAFMVSVVLALSLIAKKWMGEAESASDEDNPPPVQNPYTIQNPNAVKSSGESIRSKSSRLVRKFSRG